MFGTREPDRWLHYVTLGVSVAVAALFLTAGLMQDDNSEAAAQAAPTISADEAGSVDGADDAADSSDSEARADSASSSAVDTTSPAPLPSAATPVALSPADTLSPALAPATPAPTEPPTTTAPDVSSPTTEVPATTAAPTTTTTQLPTIAAPVPPARRFAAEDVSSLMATAGGEDPVGTALEVLRRSGPLGVELASSPIMSERLADAFSGTQPFGTGDFAERILTAANSAIDSLAGDRATAGTGLCLIIGTGECVQVPALNHSFSALPHRARVDDVLAAFGNDASSVQIGRLADLHFTGNAWSLLREAHSAVLVAELRHSWMNAGVPLAPHTAELAGHAVFVRAYMDAARDERPETWAQMLSDGTSTGVATTWNMIVAAFVTDDDAYWNVAFLPDSSSIVELTGGRAGNARPPR